jgi:hydrogenase expression/formation protein HypC
MCLAIPGKITEIKKDIATVDYGSEKRRAKIVQGKFKVGDYVIVQAKIVSEKVPEKKVTDWLSMLAEEK